MNELRHGLQNAIDYIEENLCEELEISNIAAKAYISSFYFQRLFNATCGITVSEYIRSRRLSLAGEELITSDIKVIDVALKYGYDSPDSFSRAFTKFHGVTPSSAKQNGAFLKCFAPIKLELISTKGGTLMEYKIVEKSAFTIMGKCRRFKAEDAYVKVPDFWGEHYASGGGETVMGMFGACIDGDGKEFDYLIADLYYPWKEIPKGYETRTFEAGTWVGFPYKGECPKVLQDLNTKIWSDWMPNCKEYELAANYNFEFYISETEGEIWVPVKKK